LPTLALVCANCRRCRLEVLGCGCNTLPPIVCFGNCLPSRSIAGDHSRREFRSYKVQAHNNNRNPGQAEKQWLATLYRAARRELAARKSAYSDE
jgi:hypothetical protein